MDLGALSAERGYFCFLFLLSLHYLSLSLFTPAPSSFLSLFVCTSKATVWPMCRKPRTFKIFTEQAIWVCPGCTGEQSSQYNNTTHQAEYWNILHHLWGSHSKYPTTLRNTLNENKFLPNLRSSIGLLLSLTWANHDRIEYKTLL